MASFEVSQALSAKLVTTYLGVEASAIALTAAKARALLDKEPERLEIFISVQVLLQVSDVIVPETQGAKGPKVLAALGAFGGQDDLGARVLDSAGPEAWEKASAFLAQGRCALSLVQDESLYACVRAFSGQDFASAEITDDFPDFSRLEEKGQITYTHQQSPEPQAQLKTLRVRDIMDYVTVSKLSPSVIELLKEQAYYNTEIAEVGMDQPQGLGVGVTLDSLASRDNFYGYARSWTSAGIDALMSGIKKPVTALMHSGPVGIVATVPVVAYCTWYGLSEEALYRGLLISDLLTMHAMDVCGIYGAQSGIVLAAAGAVSAISYLKGANLAEITDIMNHTLAVSGGFFPDIGTESLALKASTALNNAFLGMLLAEAGHAIQAGDGIAGDKIEETLEKLQTLSQATAKSIYRSWIHWKVGDHD